MSMTEHFSVVSSTVGSLFELRSPRYGIVSMSYPISDVIRSNKFAYIKLKDPAGIAKYAVNKKALYEYNNLNKR